MANFWRGILSSKRILRSNRRFAILLILTLGVTIGSNSVVFALLERQLLRPLPYPNSEDLVWIYNAYPKFGVSDSANTVPDYMDRREQADTLQDSALFYDYSYDLNVNNHPRRVPGVASTASLFSTLGMPPALGRTFLEHESELGKAEVVVLSHALWQSEFAADPNVLGRDIRLSGKSYRVIGVMPENFAFPRAETALWVPAVWNARQRSDAMRGFEFAQSIGRLRDGASLDQLNAQLQTIAQNAVQRFAATPENSQFLKRAREGGFTGGAHGLKAQLDGKNAEMLVMLQAAVLLLLLIGCANVSSLLLIHLAERRSELRTRLALGAARADVFRMVLGECTLLCGLGGVFGLLLASLMLPLVDHLGLTAVKSAGSLGLIGVAFTLACSLICVGVFASVLWNFLRHQPLGALSAMRATTDRAGARWRGSAVCLQIALALGLLTGALLLLQSVQKMQSAELGFNPAQLITFNVNLSRDRYSTPEATRDFNRRLLQELRAIPGVSRAGATAQLPFSDDFGSAPYFVEPNAQGVIGALQIADDDYFQTMQIPLLRGRHFDASDGENGATVVIIDKALAERSFVGMDPIGQRLGTATINNEIAWHTIVGVVGSIKTRHLSAGPELPTFFSPLAQQPARLFRVVLRSQRPLAELSAPIQQALARIDPEQALWQLMTMQDRLETALDARRIPSTLWSLFTLIAVLLCALGSYSVLAHLVAIRGREISLRMALGASQSDIVSWNLSSVMRWILPGIILGSGFALMLGQLMGNKLLAIEALTPISLLGPIALITSVCLLACGLPAARAARLDPGQIGPAQ